MLTRESDFGKGKADGYWLLAIGYWRTELAFVEGATQVAEAANSA
jgi:hypothetical protein